MKAMTRILLFLGVINILGCSSIPSKAYEVTVLNLNSDLEMDINKKVDELKAAKCEFKGDIQAKPGLNDLPLDALRGKAYEVNGNVVVTNGKYYDGFDRTMRGKVYSCPTSKF